MSKTRLEFAVETLVCWEEALTTREQDLEELRTLKNLGDFEISSAEIEIVLCRRTIEEQLRPKVEWERKQQEIRDHLAAEERQKLMEQCKVDVVIRETTVEISTTKPSPKRINLTPTERFAIFKRDGYKCQICGASPNNQNTPDTVLEVDHIVCVAKGGTNDPDNLHTLCFDCNRGKGTKSL